jgi:hypothetical protein
MVEFTHEASQSRAKKENIMKKNRKMMTGMVAVTGLALAIVIGSSGMFGGAMDEPIAVADNGVVVDNETTEEAGHIMGKVAVNIEGVIEEVTEDGMSFRIGDTWVLVTEETVLGIFGPTAAPEDEQFMADKFEIGNSIAGFTLDDESLDSITAYAIYTNWNWEKN